MGSVVHSTASLLAGSSEYCPASPILCCRWEKKTRKEKQSTSVVECRCHKLTKPAEPPPELFSMSYAKGTHTAPTAMLFMWVLWHTSGPEVKARKECWGLTATLTETCSENGYVWLWKCRTTKSLSLRENPASLIPQEQLYTQVLPTE